MSTPEAGPRWALSLPGREVAAPTRSEDQDVRFDIALAGVGGQGVLFTTRLLAYGAVMSGHRVLYSEIHGLSQRGGMVATTVRVGERHGLQIPLAEADLLLGLELYETCRCLDSLRIGGAAVANIHPYLPKAAHLGTDEYPPPEDAAGMIEDRAGWSLLFDAYAAGLDAGGPGSMSVLMLGALHGCEILPFSLEPVLPRVISDYPRQAVRNEAAWLRGIEIGRSGQDRSVPAAPLLAHEGKA
jgi:indolepyruvate ferredoxin oxidoreductase beta subunit